MTAIGSNSAQDYLKLEVAAATRLLVMEDLLDYSGHLSARIPGEDAYVIQPGTDPRSDVEPERLITVDFDGNILSHYGHGNVLRPPVEIPIHGEIYKARPDVHAVLHSHMEMPIWFTMMEGVQLAPMRPRAIRWQSGIASNADPSHIKSQEQGAQLARDLGPHHACLLRAHGSVLTAESVPALFVDAVHFAENARALLQVLQAGQKPLPLTAEEMEQVNKTDMREFHNAKLWTYYRNKARKAGVLPTGWDLGA
jgi:L-ribulose-5-phosphate 4-epimerase